MKMLREMRWCNSAFMAGLFSLLVFITGCKEDTPHYVIGMSQCSDDSWRHKMNDEILREAMFYDGVSVEIRSAHDDNKKQIEDIRHFIDKKVDLLIVAPNEAAPITPGGGRGF